jgi:4-diphosphocytidyl-2C-methyl-D-erythritol kinase
VPFCLSGVPAARVGGVGEAVTPLPAPPTAAGVLLVTAPVALATADVFAELDRLDRRQVSTARAAVSTLADALADGADAPTLANLGATLRDANDLWPAAAGLAPSLGPLRVSLESRLGRPCLLTGSGPTLVALYPSPQDASLAAAGLAAANLAELRGSRIIATRTSTPGGTS